MLTRRSFARIVAGAGVTGLVGLVGCKATGDGFGSGQTDASRFRSVRYSCGGGMEGGDTSIELMREIDGTVTLTMRDRPWWNARATGKDCVVDASVVEQFVQLCDDYDLRNASKRKLPELIALDAPSTSVSYSFWDENGLYDVGASFTINDDQDLTNKQREGFDAVIKALCELSAQSEGIPYEEPIELTLSAQGVQYHFIMNESSASKDLAARCSVKVALENDGDNKKVFYLEKPLDVSDTPLATGAAGSVCYFEPENAVVFFYGDGAPAEGLYEMGMIESQYDLQYFAKVEPDDCYLWSNCEE